MSIKDFTLWLSARLLMVLGVVFSLMVVTTCGIAKYDGLAGQIVWLALLSALLYGGGAACYVTRKAVDA